MKKKKKSNDDLLKMLDNISEFLDNEIKGVNASLPQRGMDTMSGKRSLCNVLIEIYSSTEDQNIKDLATEATMMAKKMTKKLVEYYKKERGR